MNLFLIGFVVLFCVCARFNGFFGFAWSGQILFVAILFFLLARAHVRYDRLAWCLATTTTHVLVAHMAECPGKGGLGVMSSLNCRVFTAARFI